MRTILIAQISLLPASALAQQGEIAPTELGKKALQGKPAAAEATADAAAAPASPWTFGLNVGLSGAFSDSRDVVGQLDGATKNLGLVLDGEASWLSGQHEVENLLKIQHGQTSAPPTDVFVKSADKLDLASTYLYYLEAISWLGPYVRAKLSTAILPGNLVFAEPVDVARNGGPKERVEAGDEISLTGAVEPLTLVQSAGLFAKPVNSKLFALDAKLGAGAQEIFVRDGAITADEVEDLDEDGTKDVVLADLEGSTAAGAEFEVAAGGALTDSLSYRVRLNSFMPMTGVDLTFGDGLQTDFEAKLSKWASLDYVLSAKKIPAIQGPDAKYQVSNALMVTAGFNVL